MAEKIIDGFGVDETSWFLSRPSYLPHTFHVLHRVLLHLHVSTSGEVYLAADGKNGTFSCPLRLEDWMKKGLHFSHILKIAPWEISLSPCFSDNLSKG